MQNEFRDENLCFLNVLINSSLLVLCLDKVSGTTIFKTVGILTEELQLFLVKKLTLMNLLTNYVKIK